MPRAQTFEQFLDEAPVGALQWRVIALCAAVAMCDGFDTQAIAFVAPAIAKAWQIKVSAFGPVFAAGLFGLMLAALGLGVLGDRLGRKRIILVSLLLMGASSLAASQAHTLPWLMAARFCVGLGVGGAMPGIIALTAEYAPQRARSLLVTIMFIGVPMGAVFGGLAAPPLIGEFGWPAVFLAGGVLPLALLPLVMVALPESAKFLRSQTRHHDRARRLWAELGWHGAPREIETPGPAQTAGASIGLLFTGGLRAITLTLWLIFFCSLLVMYLLINWLPVLLGQAGLPPSRAIFGTVLLNLGGALGGLFIAYRMDRGAVHRTFMVAYLAAALLVASLGFAATNAAVLMALIFLAGFSLMGAQVGMNALAAAYYPTVARATGVGWALGIGRIGSIIGPVAGGMLIGSGAGARIILLLSALPIAACVAGILLLAHFDQRRAALD